MERARSDKRLGKAATTQAGEFVREEMHHKKTGKHPVKNRKQAIAIGLSKARRAGVALKKPRKAKVATTRKPTVSASRKTVKTTTRTATTRRRRANTAAKKPTKTTRARTTTATTAAKKKSASK